jgi:hypothetical protein
MPSRGRAAEILALVAPLVLATPLSRQIGMAAPRSQAAASPRGALIAAVAVTLLAGIVAYGAVHRFEPNLRGAPGTAVTELKKLNVARVLVQYRSHAHAHAERGDKKCSTISTGGKRSIPMT